MLKVKKLLIIALSAALVVGLASCGTETSADTYTAAAETEAAEPETAAEAVTERVEWSLDDIEALSDIVTGVTDREYAVNEGADYKIHEDITYDHDIVYTVLFNTAGVRFDVPGEYEMIYWVYFDAAALSGWADENGMTLDIPDTDRLAVWVYATVTVTEAEEEETEEDAEDAGDETDIPDDGTSTASSVSSGGSAKSASSGSSKGGSSTCNHNWVDQGHYESVLVTAAYDSREKVGSTYQCNGCGFQTTNDEEIIGHTVKEGCGYKTVYLYETVHHDAVYKTEWVSSYKCSKCGATK